MLRHNGFDPYLQLVSLIVPEIDVRTVDTAIDSSGSCLKEIVVIIKDLVSSVSFVDFSEPCRIETAMPTAIDTAKALATVEMAQQILCRLQHVAPDSEPF